MSSVGEAAVGLLAVEHDDDGVDACGPAFGEPAAGRDLDRLPDRVQRDAMARRQRLDGGDAGNDLVVEGLAAAAIASTLRMRAVVERGIAPGEDGADLALAQPVGDHLLEQRPAWRG